MFQDYLCVISDNIRVNDNIFRPGFQNMLSLTLLLSQSRHFHEFLLTTKAQSTHKKKY